MNFRHILFPVDFSERSKTMNPEVEWMANRFGSRVTLMSAYEIPTICYGSMEAPVMGTETFRELSEAAEESVRDYQINVPENRVERVAAEGGAARNISDWARDHDVDLIMMGTHGYGNVGGLLRGSTAARVIHDARCPVWADALHHSAQPVPISKIVCAVDLDEETLPLLCTADVLAKDLGASVTLVHSVRKVHGVDRDACIECAREELAGLQRQAGTEFPAVITSTAIASAAAEIARKESAGLILIGRGRISGEFGQLRTHVCNIIGEAPCPVLSCAVS